MIVGPGPEVSCAGVVVVLPQELVIRQSYVARSLGWMLVICSWLVFAPKIVEPLPVGPLYRVMPALRQTNVGFAVFEMETVNCADAPGQPICDAG